MKTFVTFVCLLIITIMQAQTKFKSTAETFKNGEIVYAVVNDGINVGEFWPVHGINLVTKKTDPKLFNGDLATLQERLGGIATSPDGFTAGSFGNYALQGKSLSHGRPCGDGFAYDYGIVLVSSSGFQINFTHTREKNVDSLYTEMQASKSTMFFLPSIYRNGNFLQSDKLIDKVLVRRMTYTGEQIGVILFNELITCNRARQIILGLDKQNGPQTTHIYVLDGGPNWGQACKQVNGEFVTMGTRDSSVVTNYLVFY